MVSNSVHAFPESGTLFREFSFVPSRGWVTEIDPGSKHSVGRAAGTPESLEISDLAHAVRAEVAVEYWGGHIGTVGHAVSINDSSWVDFPRPAAGERPENFYRVVLGGSVEIPLTILREGHNSLKFRSGPQKGPYSFGWGYFWIYSLTVRIYYDPSLPHASGVVVWPEEGFAMGDRPLIKADVRSGGGIHPVAVDFLASFKGPDVRGMGITDGWHYRTEYGQLRSHIGTATHPPYAVRWDTTWVPEQDAAVRILAIVTGSDGRKSVSPVRTASLRRSDRSVRMYLPVSVPENFATRLGRPASCEIDIPDDLSTARAARLLVPNWCGGHADELRLNDRIIAGRFGFVHDYSFDEFTIPVSLLRRGTNTFSVMARTEHHAVEINVPGPAILVEFDPAPPAAPDTPAPADRPQAP